MTTLAEEYNARHIAIRCLCPPDKLIPRSPISAISPPGINSMSGHKAHNSSTF